MALLTPWRPISSLLEEMSDFQRNFGRLFDRWGFERQPSPRLALEYPPMNLWEDDDCVYAEAELPGIKLENLEIYVTGDDQLTVKGMRQPLELKKVEWHRQERPQGSFERVIILPAGVDAAKVEARLENGVLTIKMAKSAAAKPKKIPVKAE